MTNAASHPMKTHPRPRRGRDINEMHRTSTPRELLFDLTFVVAIASAASQLHNGVVEHHPAQAVAGYLLAFAGIWWAWMNYTWFASAYDSDDTQFRILTMIQMGGVLIMATGIPGMFIGQFMAGVIGYVVMRLALCVQWLLAAQGDPPRRRTCIRYATGVALVQLGWVMLFLAIIRFEINGTTHWMAILVLWFFELLVPFWAERAGETPWHAHHIAERYGLMVIIVLGECVLGTTNALASMWQTHGWSFDLALIGFGGTLLIFSLWWQYFLLPSAEALHHHRERAWGWGYGHFVLFAAVAAVGSGLVVIADVLKNAHDATGLPVDPSTPALHISAFFAISMVALAEALFVVSLWALHRHATRARNRQQLIMFGNVGAIALGPLAVFNGLPLSWGLILLSVGPLLAIAYNEKGRRHCAEHFAVR